MSDFKLFLDYALFILELFCELFHSFVKLFGLKIFFECYGFFSHRFILRLNIFDGRFWFHNLFFYWFFLLKISTIQYFRLFYWSWSNLRRHFHYLNASGIEVNIDNFFKLLNRFNHLLILFDFDLSNLVKHLTFVRRSSMFLV